MIVKIPLITQSLVLIVPSGIETDCEGFRMAGRGIVLIVPSGIETVHKDG